MSLNTQFDAELAEAKWAESPLALQPGTPGKEPGSQWWPILLIVLPLAATELAMSPLMAALAPTETAALLVYACLGFVVAQGALLSIGLVFGNENFSRRLALHWGTAVLLCLCSLAGFWYRKADRFESRDLQNALQVTCALPLIALATQAPLWFARLAFGWRLKGRCRLQLQSSIGGFLAAFAMIGAVLALYRCAGIEDRNKLDFRTAVIVLAAGLAVFAHNLFARKKLTEDEPVTGTATESGITNQISIRDLFIATAVIAVSLAIARLMPIEASLSSTWVGVAIFAISSAAASLLMVLPLLWFFARFPLRLGWLFGFGYVGIYALIFLLLSLSGIVGPIDPDRLCGWGITVVAIVLGIGGGLMQLRLNGVELERGR